MIISKVLKLAPKKPREKKLHLSLFKKRVTKYEWAFKTLYGKFLFVYYF